MPSRGRRRGSSQGAVPRASQGSIRRSSGSRGVAHQSLRRSARIRSLLRSAEILSPEERALQENHQAAQTSSSNPGLTEDSSRSSQFQQASEILSSVPDVEAYRSSQNHLPTGTGDEEWNTGTEDLMPSTTNQGRQPIDPYNLTILVQPPNQVRPSRQLYPPIVVRVEQQARQGPGGFYVGEPSLLWAWVSVVAEGDETAILDPDLLQGTPVDSIQGLAASVENGNTEWSDRVIGYASFSDIAIREPGRYKIMISLIRMNVNADLNESGWEGGVNLQRILSRVIRVDRDANPSMPGQ